MIKSGVALYSIEFNGCLNGVYTNEAVDGEIFNEIARKTDDSEGLVGTYKCSYFEQENSRHDAKLTIAMHGDKKNTYTFRWVKDGQELFSGVGYQINAHQLLVHYRSL